VDRQDFTNHTPVMQQYLRRQRPATK